MTLAEALAIAVLKGDQAAAYALVDRLTEERQESPTGKAERVGSGPMVLGMDVYDSPEFRAFCSRFGILVSLATVELEIRLPVEGPMSVTQKYLGTEGQ